jgi:hypothetical protein
MDNLHILLIEYPLLDLINNHILYLNNNNFKVINFYRLINLKGFTDFPINLSFINKITFTLSYSSDNIFINYCKCALRYSYTTKVTSCII